MVRRSNVPDAPARAGRPLHEAPYRKPREIDWAELRPQDLSDARKHALAEEWRLRMIQEHLAVGAFSELAHELAASGCDTVVLAMVTRAAADEVRHGELCRRVALGLGGHVSPERLSGVPKIPEHPGVAPREKALLHVVEMGCLSETFTGVYLTRMLARAENPAMHAAVASLLSDEIDHGRLGWAHLAACARDGLAACVGVALPAMLDRTMGDVMTAPLPGKPHDPVLASYGQICLEDAKSILSETLREVILPGFEAAKVDISPAYEHARARGFI